MTEVAASTSRYDRSIVEGPLRPAVWKIAWPTMLTNAIGGLQGMVDHVLVGNLVGYKANAAIGVSWQIFLVVIIVLIRGLGPIPSFGTRGSAMGTCITAGLVAIYALWKLWSGGWVVAFPRGQGWGPDWSIIRELFRFGLPTGIQGIAMNIGGVFMLSFIGSLAQSAAAQAAFAVSYTELFSLITWTSVGLMGSAAAVAGQNLGAGHPDRANEAVHLAARYGLSVAAFVGLLFAFLPRQLLALF